MPTVARMFLRRALEKDPAKRVRDSGRSYRRVVRSDAWMAAVLLAADSTGFVVWTMNTDRERRAVSFYIDPPRAASSTPRPCCRGRHCHPMAGTWHSARGSERLTPSGSRPWVTSGLAR
jgi:hypothetical protein